jgi:hypothetical protein
LKNKCWGSAKRVVRFVFCFGFSFSFLVRGEGCIEVAISVESDLERRKESRWWWWWWVKDR